MKQNFVSSVPEYVLTLLLFFFKIRQRRRHETCDLYSAAVGLHSFRRFDLLCRRFGSKALTVKPRHRELQRNEGIELSQLTHVLLYQIEKRDVSQLISVLPCENDN